MSEPDDTRATPPPAPAPAASRRRRLRAWWMVPLVLVLLLAALTGGLGWSLATERGSAWLLSVVPGVQVEAPRGPLLGDFDAQRVVVHLPGSGTTVTLAGLRWRGLAIARAPSPLWATVTLAALDVRRIDVATAPASSNRSTPPQPPTDLRLPIALDLQALRIAELHLGAPDALPLRDVQAHVRLGADGGATHRVEQLALAWDRLQARGEAHIATSGTLALAASLGLAQPAGGPLPAWQAAVAVAGPLAAPALQATLRAEPAGGRPPQTLDAHALLRPFAAWPLGALQASTQSLDLSALVSNAPTTALSGEATATTTSADQPASVRLTLTNALPGRWNERRLPLRSAALEIVGRPDQPGALALQGLVAELGSSSGAEAGRVTGQGQWSAAGWSLSATLAALQPAGLDARAPAMRLSGPLTLTGTAAAGGQQLAVQTALSGALAGLPDQGAVQLKLNATLALGSGAQRIELREAQAIAGGARATASGLLTQSAASAPWVVKAQAGLVAFDPAVWWPGREDSPWRRAAHKLNATAHADLSLPAAALAQPAPALLMALRGSADLALTPSVLAGVPLSGRASWRSGGNSTGNGPAAAELQLDADGNTLRATGRLATGSDGSGDAWDVALAGPDLARLSPVFALLQGPGADATLAGTLNATAHVAGRWPAVSTQGQLEANALRVGAVSLQQAQARWSLASADTAPVDLQASITQARLGAGSASDQGTSAHAAPGPSLASLQLQLKGTARAHTLTLRADSAARPPAWADAAAAGNAHTLVVLQAQGGLVDNGGEALAGWRGTVQQLDVRGSTAGATPLLQTSDVALETLWAGGPASATVQAGRAQLLGGAVQWGRIAWQAASAPGGAPQIAADLRLEPLRVAPLLARLQPAFGWGGDLTLGGHLTLQTAAANGVRADAVIERSTGDLTVTDELGTRALGLTDLRLGLTAADGVWNFTQGLAGRAVGVASGAVVARTTPGAAWPPADAPLQGVFELRVADLGTLSTWVPPGWRIEGALHSNATIGGRFGAPEFTGRIEGTGLAVRNFLEGVNVTDGDVAIALQGTTARIERFTAKAGNGSVTLAGNATLGDAPQALLQLNADHFQLLGRIDRRIVTSGQGQLRIDPQMLAFDGRFGVDDGLIDFTRSDAPSLSDDVVVVQRPNGAPSPAAAASAAATPPPAATGPATASPRHVALALQVDLGEKLRLRGHGLDTGLRGELRITSPGGRLSVDGTVRTAEGTYAAYGQKLAIDRGLITFNGPVENPRLDIEATRPDIDTRVGVIISGTAASPRVRLFSEPELSEIDKLSWLVMGHASDSLANGDTALLQRAALALLAGEGGGPTDQLTKALGLDDLSVRQSDGEVKETVIALGKQLSKRWYVGYERGLNAAAGSFQLIYRIAQRFTLRAQSGDDNSLDVIWTWRWQ